MFQFDKVKRYKLLHIWYLKQEGLNFSKQITTVLCGRASDL